MLPKRLCLQDKQDTETLCLLEFLHLYLLSHFLFKHAWTIFIVGTLMNEGIRTEKAVDKQFPLAFLNYWYFYAMRRTEVLRQERLFFSHFLKMAQW